MYRYQNNAFRVLGLLPSASTQEIMGRVSEIKVKKSLGFDIVYDYDFPWMGPLDRSDENVINALQRLENPVARLKEEFFWFWIESDEDKKALDYLIQNKRQSAHEIWRRIAYNWSLQNLKTDSAEEKPSKTEIEVPAYQRRKIKIDPVEEKPSQETIRACLNGAVLAHSSVIAKEFDLKYQQGELKEQKMVQEESEVLCCPNCQKIYDKELRVCLKCGVNLVVQKTKNKEKIIKSRDSNTVLSESHWKNWRFAVSRFLLLKSSDIFWDSVVKKIRIINDPRLTEAKIDELRNNFLSEVAAPNFEFISKALAYRDYERTKWHSSLINGFSLPPEVIKNGFNQILNRHSDLLNQYCDDITKEISLEKEKGQYEKLVLLYQKFNNQIKDIIYEGNLVDINCTSDFALDRDKVANILRNLSIDVHNKFHLYDTSYEIINEAIEYAASPYLKERFKKDGEVIRQNLVLSQRQQSDSKQQPVSKNPKEYIKYIPWWVWVGGFIILISIFLNKLPSYQSGVDASLSALKSRIVNLKSSLESKDARMKELSAEIKAKKNEMDFLKSSIKNIEAQYKDSFYDIPSDVQEDYNNKIDKYNNNLLPAYNSLQSQLKKLYNEYQQEAKTHDELVESYNKRIR